MTKLFKHILFVAILISLGWKSAAVASAGITAASPVFADLGGTDSWAVYIILAFISAGAGWVLKQWLPGRADKVKVQQPVRIVIDEELHKQFVARTDFVKLEVKVEKMEGSIEEKLDALRDQGEERKDAILGKLSTDTRDMHRRMDVFGEKMSAAIAELRGELRGRFPR